MHAAGFCVPCRRQRAPWVPKQLVQQLRDELSVPGRKRLTLTATLETLVRRGALTCVRCSSKLVNLDSPAHRQVEREATFAFEVDVTGRPLG